MPDEIYRNNADNNNTPKKINEGVDEALSEKNTPQIQKDLMKKSPFPPSQPQPKPISNDSNTHVNQVHMKKRSSSTQILWIFFGIVGFIILGILLGLSMLVGRDGGTTLAQFGISNAMIPGLVQTIHGFFIFFIVSSLLSLLISGALYATDPKRQKLKKGIAFMFFSGIMLCLSIFMYIPAISQLSRVETTIQENFVTAFPTPPIGSAPFEVSFDASKLQRNDLFYEWNFGDGTPTANGVSVRHTYENVGIYNVSLVVSDGTGRIEEIPTNIVVSVNNAKAKPIITADVLEGVAPLTVNFDASQSTDPNGVISEYFWNFDDSRAQVNERRGIQSRHTFNDPGNYEVTLTLIDNNNEQVKSTQTIVVLEPSEDLIPEILASPIEGYAPLTVSFNADGSNHRDADRSIVSYEWDFGDGKEASTKKTNHEYLQAGVYIATLTIRDDIGNSAQEFVNITVLTEEDLPEALIVTAPQIVVGEAPFTVTFDASTSSDADGSIVDYEWTIIDEDFTETDTDFSYTFEDIGEYIVNLEVTDNDDNKSRDSVTITVTDPGPQDPVAVLTTNPTPAVGVRPFNVEFDASESSDADGTIISYLWDFGDGSPTSQTSVPQALHQYDRVGNWPASVTVYDNTGSSSSVEVIIAVNSARPKANITASNLSAIAPAAIDFTADGTTGQIAEYNWDFGNGATARGREVSQTFRNSGQYTIQLTVTDSVGQSDVAQITIDIQ